MANLVSLDEETAKKVIRQVEFYFSDSNLPRDSFLMQSIHDSEDGMVSLALICSFSRMRSHLGLGDAKPEDICVDTVEAVAETLRASSALKVSEDGQRVGRTTELSNPEEVIEQLDVKTIAASPLPYDVSIEDVESFFAQYAKVNSVRLPRHVASKKCFCGTALIEFSSEEDATKVLEQSLVYAGTELELKPKKDFDVERTKQEEAAVVISRCQRGSKNKKNGIPQERERYPKGLIVAFKLKRITADGATNKNGSLEPAADVGSPESSHTSHVATDMKEQKPSEDVQADNLIADVDEEKEVQKDGVDVEEQKPSEDDVNADGVETETPQSHGIELALCSSGQKDEQKDEQAPVHAKAIFAAMKDNKDVVLREDLKSAFQKFGTVKYVDFKMGSDSGYIRFEDAEASRKARAVAVLAEEGGLVVKNYIAILDPLQGEAEEEYWSQLLMKKYPPGKFTDLSKGKNKRSYPDSARRPKKIRFSD